MKIDCIRTHHLRDELDEPFGFSPWYYSTRNTLWVEIMADDGTTGWGECEQTRYGLQRLLSPGGVQIAQPDLAYCGGVSEAMKIRTVASSTRRCMSSSSKLQINTPRASRWALAGARVAEWDRCSQPKTVIAMANEIRPVP